MNLRQLPNALTVLRMLAVAPLVWLLDQGRHDAALWVVFGAGVSDALDGFLAKQFGWQSRLGGLLDPLADKLLLDACFLGLWAGGSLPGWLAALVVGRDVVILAGAAAWHWLIRPLTATPSLLSKATTLAQVLLVLAWLLHLAHGWLEPAVLDLGVGAVAALTALSGLDYVLRWSLMARREGRAGRGT